MWAAFIPAALTVMGSFMSASGSLAAGRAARTAGAQQQAASEFESAQLEQQAGQAIAASQRVAADRAREGRLVQSRALAVAAASGGSASDPTVMRIIANINGEATYRQALALYQGDDKARQLLMGADAKRFEGAVAAQSGKAKQSAYRMAAAGSALAGAGSLYTKYGGSPKSAEVDTSTASSIDWELT